MEAPRLIAAIFVLLVVCGAQALANPRETVLDCLGEDNDRRISGCTVLIETPDLPPEQRSLAHGMRALAYSMKGMFEKSLHDYDRAISLKPDFAAALNNRAWAYFKLGRASEGSKDVEHALRLSPGSPYALDTRAHIRQVEGDADGALTDYELAMRHGGDRLTKLYQCGLRSQGLYFGAVDGVRSNDLRRALRVCVGTQGCDPLPADEDCKPTVS